MAATVASIIAQIKVIANAKLDPEWKELPYVTDLSKNDARRGVKGYGARPLGAADAATVLGSYSLDHTFELVLMSSNARKSDESQAMTLALDLFDKQDEIYKAMVSAKLNLAGTVLIINSPNLSEPEFVNGTEFVALRQQFNVRYRQSI